MNQACLKFFTLIAFINFVFSQNIPTEDYSRNAFLDSEEIVQLFWNANLTYITFEVYAPTTGWIGIGFSPDGGMAGSDIIVGWVNNGKVYVTDRHGPQSHNGFPPLDTKQNIFNIDGTEVNGTTMIKFTRKLATCDMENDRVITADTTRMIYAFGRFDPKENEFSFKDQHEFMNRGSRSLFLLEHQPVQPPPPTDIKLMFSFRNNGHAIPIQNTYYNCRILKIPDLPFKHHIIGFEPIIMPLFIRNVHHMTVSYCTGDVPEKYVNVNQECYTKDLPKVYRRCINVMAAWAVGGEAFNFPEEAGYSIGGENSPKYFLLEMHYDNPTGIEIRDFSGMMFTYTSELRQFDAAAMSVGHSTNGFSLVVPPNQNSYLIEGQCEADCLSGAMEIAGVNEINIFATVLHSHLAGRAMKFKHIRNGTELPPIASDKTYDFNYQNIRSHPIRTVKNGDTLATECIYQTKKKSVFGGLGTEQEMCLSFAFYYPSIPIGICVSAPVNIGSYLGQILNIRAVGKIQGVDTKGFVYLNYNDIPVTAPAKHANKTMGQLIDEYEWTLSASKEMNNFQHDDNQFRHCFGIPLSGGSIFQPSKVNSFVEPERECKPESDIFR